MSAPTTFGRVISTHVLERGGKPIAERREGDPIQMTKIRLVVEWSDPHPFGAKVEAFDCMYSTVPAGEGECDWPVEKTP